MGFALTARVAICVVAATVSLVMSASCAANVPSGAQILHAVQQKSPGYFDSRGYSKIHIINVTEPQRDWFIASIHVDGAGETGKIILHQDNPPNGPLTVVAVPGTSFPLEYVSLPDAVRKGLGPA
jgi:hypothetical protein